MEGLGMHAELMRTMLRFKQLNLGSALGGVRRGEYMSLEALYRFHMVYPEANGMYVSALAERLSMSTSAVSRMLRTLEEKEMVERSVDTEDRRNTYIRITENGRRMYKDGFRFMHQFMEKALQEMGEEDVRTLLTLTNRLADTMEKILNQDEGEQEC